MTTLQTEVYLLYLAILFYAMFSVPLLVPQTIVRQGGGGQFWKGKVLNLLISVALVLHALSIAVRWSRSNHGPFINLYEILSSNVWSLFFGFALYISFFKGQGYIAKFVLPVIWVLVVWLLSVGTNDSYLPPTYNTIWLYFHLVSGKIFFTLLLIATGLAATNLYHSQRSHKNHSNCEDMLAYRFLAFAFVFDSFMLLFGAIWAQDAWGRYWAWDPLETWAFLTWLMLAFTLHLKLSLKKGVWVDWSIIACFIIAFLTFFGIPFLSVAAHKGVI